MGACGCWACTREAVSFLWFCRRGVYPVKHTRLLTLELLITLKIALAELNGELQVLTMNAPVGTDDAPIRGAKETLNKRSLAGFEKDGVVGWTCQRALD